MDILDSILDNMSHVIKNRIYLLEVFLLLPINLLSWLSYPCPILSVI